MMRILYVTGATFRHANAAALRNIGLASALALAGHDVVIATPDPDRGAAEDAPVAWLPKLPGRVHISCVRRHSPIHSGVRSLIGRSHGALHDVLRESRPDVVILYQAFLPLLVSLRRAAAAQRVPVVLDMTEWYDGASLPLGTFGPHNILNQISMRFVAPRMPYTIAISEPLADHCSRRGGQTIVVPPLFDLSGVRPQTCDESGGERDRKLSIAVTGSGITPGQKDRLALLSIATVARRLDPDGKALRIRVAGPSRDAVATELGGEVPAAFEVLGPLSWSESLALVADSDYTLLLRDSRDRRAAFGFPSKVSESLLLGTPILGNTVGDLALYLEERRNAIVVPVADAFSLEKVVQGLLDRPVNWDRDAIRADARAKFAPEQHAHRLDTFLTRTMEAA